MMSSLPQPLTFSAFLTFMSNAICDVSSREELTQALGAFHDDNGSVPYSILVDALVQDGMSESDVVLALGGFKSRAGFKGEMFRDKDFIDVLRGSA
jgi:Ca2+-binding EF-hand superfamily protein